MAAPSPACPVWRAGVLTLLLAAVVHSNTLFDYDPLQPSTTDETVSVGGTVTLTCRVDESDNSSLQWSNTAQQTLYFGEKRALRDNRIQLHRSTSTELSITISEVQLSDEGEYTCSIFTMPVRTTRAMVTVLGVPTQPQISGFEEAVPEGGEVTLTCTSSGSKPPAGLEWYRGDEKLEARQDVVTSTPGEPTYSVRSEVTLKVSRSDDNALVTCAAVHPSLAPGDKRSQQPLHVLYSPDVKILPQSNLPKEGERFHLKCEGTGNPEPSTFSWEKKDGGELGPQVTIDRAFLYFEMLNKSHNGAYLCLAGNGIGSQGQGEYTLHVQDSDFTSTAFSPTTALYSPTTAVYSPTTAVYSPTTAVYSPTTAVYSPTTAVSSPTPSAPEASGPTSTTTASLSNALFPDLAPAGSMTPPSAADHTHHDHTHSDHTHHDHTHSHHDHTHSYHTHSDHTHHDHTQHADRDHTRLAPTPTSMTPPSAADHTHRDHTHSHRDHTHPHLDHAPTATVEPSGVISTDVDAPDPTVMTGDSGVDHAVIGGVVAVIVFILLCLLIVLGRYLIRHKGTYLTHEAKGSDDAPDADTAIINAEGGTSGGEDKKEYFI